MCILMKIKTKCDVLLVRFPGPHVQPTDLRNLKMFMPTSHHDVYISQIINVQCSGSKSRGCCERRHHRGPAWPL